VKIAHQLGLIDGMEPGIFAPMKNITYAQVIKLAACMRQLHAEGQIYLRNGTELWYSTYVDYAAERGIVTRKYDYGATATRGEFMDIFSRALPAPELEAINSVADGAIPDVTMAHPYAAGIYKLYRAGIVQGSNEFGACMPDTPISRAEVAAILTRMMDKTQRKSFTAALTRAQ
jgi:hypothetical protein